MKDSLRTYGTGRHKRPVQFFRLFCGSAAGLALVSAPVPAAAQTLVPGAGATLAAGQAGQGIDDFYRSRGDQPLWLAPQSGNAAQQLMTLLSTAQADGLDPGRYKVKAAAKAIRQAWGGDSRAVRRAEELISSAFVAYAQDLKRPPEIGMQYVDPDLKPAPPSARALLEMAAAAPSLDQFIAEMGWMDPSYAPLRRALISGTYQDSHQLALLKLNMERARALPGGTQRYVIVNAAAQRLYMYEGGQLVDSMRVVVGKQKDRNRTPMMAAKLRFASLNPYWNVPPDLAAERIAPNVVKEGLGYLKSHGYQLLSDWGDNPTLLDPSTVDWQAVADGTAEVRIRQLPGPGNALGKVKFSFPNPYGVYLHDTPDKKLLNEDTRLFSGGCIRLEDASRFGKWLFGHTLTPPSRNPEIRVPLDSPVPVYVTYLTAVPSGSSITFLDDVYGWDAQRLATRAAGTLASR